MMPAPNVRRPLRVCFWLVGWGLLTQGTACQPAAATLVPAVSPSPSPTGTPTPTIVWFPPTETPTPFSIPTVEPTPDTLAGVGDLLYRDDFSANAGWALQTSSRATAPRSPPGGPGRRGVGGVGDEVAKG